MEQLPGVDNEQWSPEILDTVIDRNPNCIGTLDDVGMSFDHILTHSQPKQVHGKAAVRPITRLFIKGTGQIGACLALDLKKSCKKFHVPTTVFRKRNEPTVNGVSLEMPKAKAKSLKIGARQQVARPQRLQED